MATHQNPFKPCYIFYIYILIQWLIKNAILHENNLLLCNNNKKKIFAVFIKLFYVKIKIVKNVLIFFKTIVNNQQTFLVLTVFE